MVGPGIIIAQRLRRITAQEDGTGIADPGHDLEGVFRDDLQMLGGDDIGCIHQLIHRVTDKNEAVVLDRAADDIRAGKDFDEAVDLRSDLLGKLLVSREQDGAGHGIVLRLGQKIRRHIAGICSAVRDDQDLAGTGDRVDAGHAETGFFGQGDKNISGSGDLVHARNGLCSVGHGRDRLGAADLIDLVRTRNIGSHNGSCRRLSGRIRRGGNNNALDTGNLCRNDIHQDTGGVNSPAARHIAAGNGDRRHFLTEYDPLFRRCDPALGDLFFMIGADIFRSPPDDFDKFRSEFAIGRIDLLAADPYGRCV